MIVTTDPAAASLRYDRRTAILHWLTAGLVLALWGIAQIIDEFPKGPLRIDVRSVHITLGVILVGVMAFRVYWRATAGRALPPADSMRVFRVLSKTVHYLLYVLVTVQLLSGMGFAWLRGDSYFNMFRIADPGAKALKDLVGDVHGLTANLILIVAALHAGAALYHHFALRDGVLRRMYPEPRS